MLAPLAGFTDAPFRRLCFEGGADLCYSEMISASGLAHGSSPTCHLMETMAGEGPVALQLFGAKEDELALATEFVMRFLERRGIRNVVELNLNAGCPMTKVTREGAGAKLIEDPRKIGRLLKAMVTNGDLPVTLKTRLGPHPQAPRIFSILDEAVAAGAMGLVVHARYTSQLHGGAVWLDCLAEVVARAPIPVRGNGSVTDHATFAAMKDTGVEAVLIGRAALANPTIFAALKAGRGTALLPPPAERGKTALRHLDYLLAFRNQLASQYPQDHIPGQDAFASVKLHTHLFRYFSGLPGAAALRARLNTIRTDIPQVLAELTKIW